MLEPLYEIDGDQLVPSEYARGPWDPRAQHGGPVCAALGRAMEGEADDGFAVVRFAAELMRPIPLKALRIDARTVRGGKRVRLVEATLWDGDEQVVRAAGWLMRVGDEVAPSMAQAPPPPGPDHGVLHDPGTDFPGFWLAVEWRFVAGTFTGIGPSTGWCRLRTPLVAGEEPSPLQRVLVAADFGNGISSSLPWEQFVFVNVDLTVHLHRYPAGEWVCLDATTDTDPAGIGIAASRLYDERGPIGRAAQALLVDRRVPG